MDSALVNFSSHRSGDMPSMLGTARHEYPARRGATPYLVLHNASQGEYIDLLRARRLERHGSLSEGGSGGEDVIHDQHHRIPERYSVGDGERLSDILAT